MSFPRAATWPSDSLSIEWMMGPCWNPGHWDDSKDSKKTRDGDGIFMDKPWTNAFNRKIPSKPIHCACWNTLKSQVSWNSICSSAWNPINSHMLRKKSHEIPSFSHDFSRKILLRCQRRLSLSAPRLELRRLLLPRAGLARLAPTHADGATLVVDAVQKKNLPSWIPSGWKPSACAYIYILWV